MWQEKYSVQCFKNARALQKKLQLFGILPKWEQFFGDETDFLDPELRKHDTVVSVMNHFATVIESKFAGQPTELLGVVLMELCKFCASAQVDDDTQHPFIFTEYDSMISPFLLLIVH